MKKRIIVGASGASGAPLTIEVLKLLRAAGCETHLIVTEGALLTLRQETELTEEALYDLADHCYSPRDIGAAPASGSFLTDGMIVVPCSMKTLAGIQSGYCENLLLRAADVTIKEQRKLVLVTRESPFSPIHLRNMYELSQMGVVIQPPMVNYYSRPESLEDLTRQIACRILDRFGIDCGELRRWEGM